MNFDYALVCSRHFASGRPAKLEERGHEDWVPTKWLELATVKQIPSPVTTKTVDIIRTDSSKICRLCLGKEVKLTRPFKDDTGDPNTALLQKIYECTTVKITLKASYPAAICAICDTKLLEYSKFRAKCIENDGILRLLLDDIAVADTKESDGTEDEIEPIEVRESEDFKDLQLQLYGSSDETTVSQSEFAGTDGGASSSTDTVTATSSPVLKESTTPPAVVTRPTISVKPISSLAAVTTTTPPKEVVAASQESTNPNQKEVNGVPAVVGPDGRLECVICARPFRNTYTLKRHMNLHTEENLFTCEYCGKKFNDRSNWKIHLRAHTGDNLLRCAVCFKTFISPSTLKYHLRAHRKLQVFECRFCAETCESYDLLADHVNAKHGDIRIDELGGKGDDSFIAGDFLKIEMEADETTLSGDVDMDESMPEPPPLIPAPTAAVVKKVAQAAPVAIAEPEVKIKEEIPDVDEIEIKQEPIENETLEPDPDGVAQLTSILPPPEEEAAPVILFRCDYCMKIFKYLYELRVHMKIHNGSKLPGGTTSGTASSNKIVDKSIAHTPSTTLVLPEVTTPPPAKRVRHPSIDEDVAELANAPLPEHQCTKCDKCFRTEELLKVHIETHKTDEDVTQARSCKVCFKTFKCELNLVSHIKKHHLYESYVTEQQQQQGSTPATSTSSSTVNDKPQSPDSSSNDGAGTAESGAEGSGTSTSGGERRCEICALTFNCPYKLEKHVLTHFKNNEAVAFVPSADRPYKCTECHKRFKRKDYLLIHIRTHTGERRHKCDLCSSAFVHPSNLITHRKLHSNERPFKCDLCSAAFKLYAGLKIHRKRCVLKYLQENSVSIT